MEDKVLYFPTKSNFILADLFYKKGDHLFAIQVTRATVPTRKITESKWKKFEETLGVSKDKVTLILCPSPKYAEAAKLEFETPTLEADFSTEIWRIPPHYEVKFRDNIDL